MNIVDLVTSQLSGDVLGKLGGLIGANETQTKSATSAAVPALLGVLSKLSSSKGGADQLASALGGLDLKTLGNLAGMLGGGQATGLGSIGGSLLSALLGNNLGKLVSTIASFAGTNPAIMKTLLTYLAPVVMGVIANQFQGGKADAAGLQRLFADQRSNIMSALPKGLSLADFDTSSGGTRAAEPASAVPAWLPLLLLPLLGLAAWMLWPKEKPAPRVVEINETRKEGPLVIEDTAVVEKEGKKVAAMVEEKISLAPGVAEAVEVGKSLAGLVGSLDKVLGQVKDEESARAAVPKLTELSPTLEGIVKSAGGLPEAGRTTLVELVAKNLEGLQKVIDTVMAAPGVKEILGPVVAPMIETISKLGKE